MKNKENIKEIYRLKVNGAYIEVSQEVYDAYYQEKHKEKYQKRKDKANKVVSYHALDTDEISGEESIYDKYAPITEDIVVENVMIEKLKIALLTLGEKETHIIQGIFFDNFSERELSEKTSIPQRTINNHKKKILSKLKKIIEI